MDFASVPIITLLVYWLNELVKQITNNNENFKRFIPIFSTLSGMILGVVVFYAFPSMEIAKNVLYAIGVGGVSGLAATGSNQIFKQLGKFKNIDPKTPSQNEKTKNDEEANTQKKVQ